MKAARPLSQLRCGAALLGCRRSFYIFRRYLRPSAHRIVGQTLSSVNLACTTEDGLPRTALWDRRFRLSTSHVLPKTVFRALHCGTDAFVCQPRMYYRRRSSAHCIVGQTLSSVNLACTTEESSRIIIRISTRPTSNAAAGSIVVAGLKKIDGFVADPVYQSVFLRNAP